MEKVDEFIISKKKAQGLKMVQLTHPMSKDEVEFKNILADMTRVAGTKWGLVSEKNKLFSFWRKPAKSVIRPPAC